MSVSISEKAKPFSGRRTGLLVLLVSLLALPAIPARELMPTDEPRFALVARQMVEDPAPIVPHLGYDALTRGGEIYGDKPPLFFWLVSLFSFVTGGVNEISARLPSLLAAIAAVLLTRRIGTLLLDETTGFTAAAILATSSQFFLRAGWCSIDMLLTALVLAATFCWLKAARAADHNAGSPVGSLGSFEHAGVAHEARSAHVAPEGKSATTMAAWGGFFAVAATLSKGPVGFIFPLAFIAGDRIAARWPHANRVRGSEPPKEPRRSEAQLLRRSKAFLSSPILAAAVCSLAPLALWIAAIWFVGGSGYVREILFRQNVTRYVAAWNNQQPWYYYLYRLPIGLFPWTLLLPAALISPRGVPSERARPLRGLLISCAGLFVFFTASTGKRGVYLLPLYPALAILLAAGWSRGTSGLHRFLARAHTVVLAGGGLLALVLLPLAAQKRAPELTLASWILGVLMATTTVVAAFSFFRGRPDLSLGVLVSGVACLVLIGAIFLVPAANRRAGVKSFGAQLAAIARPGDYLVVDQEGYEQILFYSHLKGARRGFDATRVTVADGSVILEPQELPEVQKEPPPPGDQPSALGFKGGLAARRMLTEAQRASRSVRFPAVARVLFVIRGKRAERLRASLGPAARTLLAASLSGEPYFVIASR